MTEITFATSVGYGDDLATLGSVVNPIYTSRINTVIIIIRSA